MADEDEVAESAVAWQSREYQFKAFDAVFKEFAKGVGSTLVQLPTGTGKTFLAGQIAWSAIETHGRRVLFLAHRDILIRQAHETMVDIGIPAAIEMGTQNARENDAVMGSSSLVVGTVQTLQGARLESWPRDHFGLIVTDECHRAGDKSHQAVYDWFHAAWHLGITATPDGSSCKIGNIFKSRAYRYCIKQAVIDGYLVQPKYEKCKLNIDLRGIRTTAGDFNQRDLAERISPSISLLADAIKQRIGTRFSVVFTPDVGSALSLATALGNDTPSGGPISARYVSGDSGRFGMSRRERVERLKEFDEQKTQVIVCCDLLFEGWDARHISAVVIARPTRLRYRYTQMVGRGLRICPEIGKTDCIIVDFDWQCDSGSRDLIGPVELLVADDDDFDNMATPARERIMADAERLLLKGTTPLQAIQDAKDIERHRTTMPVYLTGMAAQFEIEHYDPLAVAGLCGVSLKKRSDFLRPGYQPPYPGQIAALKKLGVFKPEQLSMFGASKLLRELEKRRTAGLASYPDIHRLVKAGISELDARIMTSTQASNTLKTLKDFPGV